MIKIPRGKEITAVLGGVKWTIRFVRRQDMKRYTWGDCCWDTRTIRCRTDLCRKNFLDTLIHEMRHAQHPITYEAEEFISVTSTEIAAVLDLLDLILSS